MKKTLFSLVLLSGAAIAAETEIIGAFGLTLGAEQDVSKLKPASKDNRYYIAPPSPNALFNEYIVEVTPASKKIMEITGFANVKDNCKKQAEAVADAVSEKYGVKKEEIDSFMNFGFKIAKDDTQVRVVCVDGIMGDQLQIRYVSGKMQQLADKEKYEQTKSQTDTSTL
ncbi:hypothetical protein [uncultured Cardiobacterium sp.]|uniref:hypothetical protein n=1 Tax=uncultured Cardiobacterium sp. TaxID=417619 RepID=UPI0026292ECE|nr:hypothetical protein [uncultured Cardiobacterium sp.]